MRLDRKMAKLLRNEMSFESAVEEWINSFVRTLETLKKFKAIKISKVLDFKEQLLRSQIRQMTSLCENYEKIIAEYMLEYAQIAKEYNRPISNKDFLLKKMLTFKARLEDLFVHLQEESFVLLQNLARLENKYEIPESESKQFSSLEKKLKEISEMNYSNFIRYLKTL